MGMPVNSKTFDEMVDQDIEWLKDNLKDDISRGNLYLAHIIGCLEMAKKYYKEVDLPSRSDSDWGA